MSRIVPGRKYTPAEIKEMRDDPELAKAVLEGYVLRAEMDGTMSFVHWSQSQFKKGGGGLRDPRTWRKPEAFEPLPPIQKRTPQQRMDSLMARVGEDVKYLRRTDSGEEAKDLARDAIELAEKEDEAAQAKKVVRRAPSE